ncbi:MAG: phosphatase PAP2 family protein [Oscillospiraceae bacterium]|nr:phosphatase PAP2 family protein [Oscillospiraceae bacterium]
MTAEQYRRISAPFRGKRQAKALRLADRGLTALCYVTYPICLLLLALRLDERLLAAIVVPGISFVVISLFRQFYPAPRPYELLDIEPVIYKETAGKSFPSRHVFSAFVIAMTYLWLCPPAGIAFLLLGTALALCRVIGGVHFPRDVLAGAVMGVLSGIIGYWLIY